MTAERNRATDIKVGLFVTIGIVTLMVVVFLIGQERHFFEQPAYLKALFPNVSGLKVGAPVRLAGVDVGIVSAIELPGVDPEADDKIMSPLDVGTLEEDAEDRGKERLNQVLDLKPVDFELPVNLSVSVRAPDDRLSVDLDVRGLDQFGDEIKETIKVRLRGRQSTVLGRRFYKRFTGVAITYLEDNDKGDTIRLGVGQGRKISVKMRVRSAVLDRIRHDSVARVDSMGLLGDKTIDISLGSSSSPPHKDGDTMRSAAGVDLNEAMAKLDQIIGDVESGVGNIRGLLSSFVDAGGDEAVLAAVNSVLLISDEIRNGQGMVHQIIFDEKAGEEYKRIVSDVQRAANKVNKTLDEVNAMVAEVKQGDGLVHGVIYGSEKVDSTIASAKGTLAEAKQILEDVRTKQGIVHQLIYDEDRGQTITNLGDASKDVKVIASDFKQVASDVKVMVADVKKGKGTMGMLITDPTVYEDLKILLGNVKRNDAVKSLVRYAIERDDARAIITAPLKK